VQNLQTRETDTPAQREVGARPLAIVDCLDGTSQDLLTLWLTQAGFRLREPCSQGNGGQEDGTVVLITDRFGPGRDGGTTITELRQRQPHLRIVIVGSGDSNQSAHLSLARVVGAHATLPAPLVREQVLGLMECWSS
jgi:hypothetical protein